MSDDRPQVVSAHFTHPSSIRIFMEPKVNLNQHMLNPLLHVYTLGTCLCHLSPSWDKCCARRQTSHHSVMHSFQFECTPVTKRWHEECRSPNGNILHSGTPLSTPSKCIHVSRSLPRARVICLLYMCRTNRNASRSSPTRDSGTEAATCLLGHRRSRTGQSARCTRASSTTALPL